MKLYSLLVTAVLLFLASCSGQSSAVEGVYKHQQDDQTKLLILVDGYASLTTFTSQNYISSIGGTFSVQDQEIEIQQEFNDQAEDDALQLENSGFKIQKNNTLNWNDEEWEKVDANPQELDGGWKITGRMQDGDFQEINHTGSRKTVKLLKDGYFQWIAIDPDQNKFYGTGGGQYRFDSGTYTEEIIFFSRDDSRVGAELSFEGELIDGNWHHKGNSSKGDPIHEVWQRITD